MMGKLENTHAMSVFRSLMIGSRGPQPVSKWIQLLAPYLGWWWTHGEHNSHVEMKTKNHITKGWGAWNMWSCALRWRHLSSPSDYISAWSLRCQVISKLHLLRWDSRRTGQEQPPGKEKLPRICTMKTTSSCSVGTHSNSVKY